MNSQDPGQSVPIFVPNSGIYMLVLGSKEINSIVLYTFSEPAHKMYEKLQKPGLLSNKPSTNDGSLLNVERIRI